VDGTPGVEIASSISPVKGEVVIDKMRPSAFFSTNLLSLLRGAGVDTLIVCGATTSGCVRATVVDALSNDYRVVIPEECVCDRIDISHRVSLEDIDAKYGDVIGLQEVIDNINKNA
jgi:nicotinamidase-related amidase